jgi:hypothetical protein
MEFVLFCCHASLSIDERVNSYARAALMKEEGGGYSGLKNASNKKRAVLYTQRLVLYYRFPRHTTIQSIQVHPVCRDRTSNAS